MLQQQSDTFTSKIFSDIFYIFFTCLCFSYCSLYFRTIHVLILNAGIFAVGWMQTIDGYESVFQVNHLSHFYLTLLLEDLLKSGSRVVILSSESHRCPVVLWFFSLLPETNQILTSIVLHCRFSSLTKGNVKEEKLNPTTPSGYSDIMAYNHSKLCNVLFATELHKRLSPRGIDVFTVHPGNMVNTGLQKHSCLYRFLFALVRPFTKSLVRFIPFLRFSLPSC